MSLTVEERASGTATSAHSATETLAPERSQHSLALILLRDTRLLFLALWLGAAVFFSFAVAPAVFSVLPARELAGAVVSRTLGIVNTGGFFISLLLLLTAFLFRRNTSRRAFYTEIVALALLALTTSTGQWIIAARLQALRAAMGRQIDEVAASDPLRIAFNSLHGYSVTALSLGMVAAIVAFLLIARRAKN